MKASKLDDPITPDELKSAVAYAGSYRPREGSLDIRPDLFTLNRHNLECEIRRLQLLCFRLALGLDAARRGVQGGDAIIIQNAQRDPEYAPYCMRCPGLVRMRKVEPFRWACGCGAQHDVRQLALLVPPLTEPQCPTQTDSST